MDADPTVKNIIDTTWEGVDCWARLGTIASVKPKPAAVNKPSPIAIKLTLPPWAGHPIKATATAARVTAIQVA